MLLFNRYEYNAQADLLGKGGFSRVYKAMDKKFNRPVALKIYKTGELSERYSLGSEIQRVINLDHPNVSRYLDIDELVSENAFGEVERIQVCVMELLDGGSILAYHRAHQDDKLLLKLLTDVLNGLAYLHENDIIHRDIKPGNILIKNTRSGPVAKITDFGISKIFGSPSNPDSSSALIVSIPYMAPEQLNGTRFGIDGHISFNIDLWSLGVATYEIYTGDVLFRNNPEDTPEQIMLNIMSSGIPRKIQQLPEPFQSFVAACVVKDARERTNDINYLIDILKGRAAASSNLVEKLMGAPVLVNSEQKQDTATEITAPANATAEVKEADIASTDKHAGAEHDSNKDNFIDEDSEPGEDKDNKSLPTAVEAPADILNTGKTVALNSPEKLEETIESEPGITGTDESKLLNDAAPIANEKTDNDNGDVQPQTDDTQILKPAALLKAEPAVPDTAGTHDVTDDTQILPSKHFFAGAKPGASTASTMLADTDATQLLAPLHPSASAINADETQMLPRAAGGQSVDADETVMMPKTGAEAAHGDETQMLPRASANQPADADETVMMPKTGAGIGHADETQLLPTGTTFKSGAEPNSGQVTAPTANAETESKTLLFKRYEYYPNKNLIGKGGFSRVYKAFDKKLQRWVALKIYKTGNFSDRYSPIAEIQRVINLDHSNICRYLDIEEIEKVNPFGEKETIQVCVMELLDSGNLLQYYQSHPDSTVFKKLLRDVFLGLSYLHKNGIIHRDIKPANILIKETIDGPIAKITDFGISKKSDGVNNNSSSALVVSIPYMAPEQLNVKKYGINGMIAFNLDLWSLGVTIYEVLTGKVLFKNSEADNSEQIMTNIMAPELPDKIKDLESPFVDIVARCIVKKAPERAQRVEELLEILAGSGKTKAYAEIPAAKPAMTEVSEPLPPVAAGLQEQPAEELPKAGSARSRFYMLDDEAKAGNPVTVPGKRRWWPALAAAILLLLVAGVYFMNRNKEASALPAKSQSTVSADTVKAAAKLPFTDSPRSKTIDSSVGKTAAGLVSTPPVVHNAPKAAARPEKKPERVVEKATPKREQTGADTYLLELNAVVDCVVKINSVNYGEIKSGGRMKVWLPAGHYLISVSDISGANTIFTRNMDVSKEQLGSVGHLRISQ